MSPLDAGRPCFASSVEMSVVGVVDFGCNYGKGLLSRTVEAGSGVTKVRRFSIDPVSYTHLTLPTIYSV